jgi:hypothetical protein
MSDIVDVAIIGAGSHRLSLAARLRTAGASYCHFDNPMRLRHQAVQGDMSLVGPRQERPYFAEQSLGKIPVLRAGTTCPRMLGPAWVEYWSILRDLVILGRAVSAIIRDTWLLMS